MHRSLWTSTNGLTAAFGLFLCLHYVIITPPASAAIAFYGLLLPCALWFGWRHRSLARATFAERSMQWVVVFLAYCIVHAVYFADRFEGASTVMRDSVQTGLFVYVTALCFAALDEPRRLRLFAAVSLVAGLGAAISVALHFHADAAMPLQPLGGTAFAQGIAALLGLYTLFRARFHPVLHAALAAAIGMGYAAVALTQNSVALLVLSVSLVLGVMAFCRHPLRWVSLALLGVGLWMAMQGAMAQGYREAVLLWAREDALRLAALWGETMRHILQAPWQGQGMPDSATHNPHNLFLATALALGVPGMVVLLLALWHLVIDRLCRLRPPSAETALNWLLLGFALASALINHSRAVDGTGPLWVLFWMPVAICIGELVRRRQAMLNASAPVPAPRTAQP